MKSVKIQYNPINKKTFVSCSVVDFWVESEAWKTLITGFHWVTEKC